MGKTKIHSKLLFCIGCCGLIEEDFDFKERFIALGTIGERLFSMMFTVRGDVLRIISLRKANKREVRKYEKQTQS
jgi:uncharacterized DUF497 family protein